MLLSLNWLRDFTPYEGGLDTLADRLTMLGLEVEEVLEPFAQIREIIVGYVAQCTAHPEADNLFVCQVDTGGGENLPIVCGAPNVRAGQKVAVAPVGCVLPNGTKIKKAKIRGQSSAGMICSETELELGVDNSGIMVLPQEATVGESLIHCLGLETHVLDVSITPNRADCLSVLGLAREVATAFDLPLHRPDFRIEESSRTDAGREIGIDIQAPELCPLYQARLLSGCTVDQSPAWMRHRLLAVGVRPVNNLVDVTNYVLMELGQPLHAFDRNLLEGDLIRVSPADKGQKFVTLDGEERELCDTDLLIRDGSKPIALAGVMGGKNTEINTHSKDVLLECAVFDPPTIRKTARRLSLSSESSFRFERGVDQAGADFALDRAASLMSEIAGGQIARGAARSEPRPFKYWQVRFRPEQVSNLLALDADHSFCERTLTSLGCTIEKKDKEWVVTPPSFRLDLEREVDLVEEVGRVFGLDRIPVHLPRVSQKLDTHLEDRDFDLEQMVKDWARGVGLNETVNYSFVGQADLDGLQFPPKDRVCIYNPLSEDQDVLRTNLLPGMLQTMRVNVGHGVNRMRLFEVAHTFFKDPHSDTKTREHNRLAVLLYGERNPRQWPYAREQFDYSDIKGLVEHLLHSFYLQAEDFVLEKDHPCLSPCVSVRVNGENGAVMGMVREEHAREYKARGPVWYAGVDLDCIQRHYFGHRVQFLDLPVYPFVKRDMTVVASPDLNYGQLKKAIHDMQCPILESVHLVDVYSPEESREKNLTVRLTYRDPQKTLKDKEVDKMHKKIGEHILSTLDVRFP